MKYLMVSIVSFLLLVAAIVDLPYGYYSFLRIVVFVFSSYCAYQLRMIYKKKVNYYTLPILIALLYNPIVRIYLDKSTWSVINLITIIIIWYPYLFKEFRNKIS